MGMLAENQLRMDAARLTMCVFVGCLLPGMTTMGTVGRWSNVAALFVTLSFHIATEIYALQNVNNSKVQCEAGPWGVVLLLSASSLLLLLRAVIFSGKLMRSLLSKEVSGRLENQGVEWKTLRSEVMKSWAAARAWKMGYFVLSLFSSGAGMIVTICVVIMDIKAGFRSSLLHQNNERGNLTFYLHPQCIFIFVGWILMLCRWLRGRFIVKIILIKIFALLY
ncbi:hypothetical protein SUGI_0215730 [Cryptomeria japonica]|nr:hypothetical protein SUGI_0215730 [Cryptomeria japonica]